MPPPGEMRSPGTGCALNKAKDREPPTDNRPQGSPQALEPDWSPQQLVAIDEIAAWLWHGDRPSFYLGGYAGTGKTTLLRHLAESAGERVYFGAYTGKAASVMRRKGCDDATTIDQLIYHHPFIWQCR